MHAYWISVRACVRMQFSSSHTPTKKSDVKGNVRYVMHHWFYYYSCTYRVYFTPHQWSAGDFMTMITVSLLIVYMLGIRYAIFNKNDKGAETATAITNKSKNHRHQRKQCKVPPNKIEETSCTTNELNQKVFNQKAMEKIGQYFHLTSHWVCASEYCVAHNVHAP